MNIRDPIAENAKLPLPETIPADQREDWLQFMVRLVAAQRHEDILLHTRVQGFVVATALLMAALSQFKDQAFVGVAALICLSGLVLAAGAFRILRRTARTIDWYLDALVRLEPLSFSEPSQRVYEARRRLLQELHTGQIQSTPYPVSALLGVWLPLFIAIIWFAVLLALAWVHRCSTFSFFC